MNQAQLTSIEKRPSVQCAIYFDNHSIHLLEISVGDKVWAP
jgi:hypothetical protein